MALGIRRLQNARRLQPVVARTYASSGFSCADPWPNLPSGTPPGAPDRVAKTATLPNGIRIVSVDAPGPLASVGVYMARGSRHESDREAGAAHMLKQMAFLGNDDLIAFKKVRQLEHSGGSIHSIGGREHAALRATCLKDSAVDVGSQLLESFASLRIAEFEVADTRALAAEDTANALSSGHTFASEALHSAAFGDSGLGRALFAHPNSLNALTADEIRSFADKQKSNKNIVIAGVGLDLDQLKKIAESGAADRIGDRPAPSVGATNYLGGEVRLASNNPSSVFAIAFKGCAWNHADNAAAAVANSILGAVSSSTSRLAAVREKGAFTADAFMNSYSDAGLFGVCVTAPSNGFDTVAATTVEALANLAGKTPSDEEVKRGIAQVKGELLMALESNVSACDDAGLQVLLSGAHTDPAKLIAAVDKVTPADVSRVVKDMFKSNPSVVVVGKTGAVAPSNKISAALSRA